MSEKEIKDIIKLSADEIFQYIIKNPEYENDVINNLKLKDRTKFFKISADLKSYKLNDKGAAASKINLLESITKDKMILSLKTEQISVNPAQPRRFYNEDNLRELSESIKENGLIQPIVVVEKESGKYELVAGERRLRAHKLSNIAEIKAIVIDVDEMKSRKLAIIENIHRADLSPCEEGLAYLELQKEGSYSLRDLEGIVKKNKNYIAARLNITKFDSDCIDFILNHEIVNVSKLNKILETEPTVHRELLEKLAKGELGNEDIEKFKINNITKLPDEVIKESTSSKAKEVDHDKFDEDSELKGRKNNVSDIQVDSDLEDSKCDTKSVEKINDEVLKQGDSFRITKDKEEKIQITINTKTLTGIEIDALKDFLETI